MGTVRYVPLLRMKRGEARALREVPDDAMEIMTPLLLASELTRDDPVAEMKSRVDDAIRTWPDDSEVWIDFSPLVDGNAADPEALLRGARQGAGARRVVPVIALDPAQATKWPMSSRLVLRFQPDDAMALLGGADVVAEVLARRGLEPSQVDVVIDLGVAPSAVRSVAMIRGLASFGVWRSVTVAAGSFARPNSAGIYRLTRDEWDAWQKVADEPNASDAGPLRYGDYGVLEPDWAPPDVPFGAMDQAPRLVYTADDVTIVVRGRSVRQHGWEQLQGLAHTITEQSEWKGASFSRGDADIDALASDRSASGNAESTMRISTNHHLTHVSRQIASRP